MYIYEVLNAYFFLEIECAQPDLKLPSLNKKKTDNGNVLG